MPRIIGIRHRVKKTAEGESRPTQVFVHNEDETTFSFDLPTETDELDFVLGRFPIRYRTIRPEENPQDFLEHHVQWRELKDGEDDAPEHQLRVNKEEDLERAWRVPDVYDGLRQNDRIAMTLGGSGDNFAYALSRQGESLNSNVYRVPPFIFQREFGSRNKDKDAQYLAELLRNKEGLFYPIRPRDRQLIWLRECLHARIEAMKARIACEQRVRASLIGRIFCSPEGRYPEGLIEKLFDQAKANDAILQALLKEEGRRERELVKACEELDIYQLLFKPIEGCGPMTASRIIASVIDIRRFEDKGKFRAFCGVHVLEDGRFPRRRNNETANWNNEARQAFYLLADQFNRRPNSMWGKRLLEAKTKYRTTHPETVEIDGKKRYNPAHTLKMAQWYTVGKLAEYIFRQWWRLERADAQAVPRAA